MTRGWNTAIINSLEYELLKVELVKIKARMIDGTGQLISLQFKYADSQNIYQYRSLSKVIFVFHDFDPDVCAQFFLHRAEQVLISNYGENDPKLFWFRYTFIDASRISPDIQTHKITFKKDQESFPTPPLSPNVPIVGLDVLQVQQVNNKELVPILLPYNKTRAINPTGGSTSIAFLIDPAYESIRDHSEYTPSVLNNIQKQLDQAYTKVYIHPDTFYIPLNTLFILWPDIIQRPSTEKTYNIEEQKLIFPYLDDIKRVEQGDVKINKASFIKGIFEYEITQYVYSNYTTIIISCSNHPIPNIYIYDIKRVDPGFTYLIRHVNKYKYEYKNNILIKYTKETGTKLNSQTTLVTHKNPNTNIITLDIECANIKGNLVPYAAGFYDGVDFTYEYGDRCINRLQSKLLIRRYNKHIVYIHNINFDFIYLIKDLCNEGYSINITPTAGPNILKATISYFTDNIRDTLRKTVSRLSFYDSYRLLPYSLSNQCKTFETPTVKGKFPFNFMDSWDKITYIGPAPHPDYYIDGLPSDYNPNILWEAKKETLKYLKDDCISLHQVLTTLSSKVTHDYGVKLSNCPSIASQAFSIYRTKFLGNNNIPFIKGSLAQFIRKAYYGGEANVYSPRGENLYSYDINSQYPYCMKKDMPLTFTHVNTEPIYHYGEIDIDNFFGFIKVKVKSPKDMHIPFLCVHRDDRLIFPLGEWEAVYFSEELKFAKNLGYTFTTIEGYEFFKGTPFNDYVDHFYETKSKSLDPIDKAIAKLMLNSLYGRMGMNEKTSEAKFFSIDQQVNYISLDKGNSNIEFLASINEDLDLYTINRDDKDSATETFRKSFSNVAIAAAITAYARMEMYKYKTIPGNECFYSDTDSVFLQHPLDPKYVNKEIGKMKLEYIAKEAIFISPKSYYIEKDDGTTLSKFKGFKVKGLPENEKLTRDDFYAQLFKDSQLNKETTRWTKDFNTFNITINPQKYSLSVSNLKREQVYKDTLINGKIYKILTSTEPLIVSE